jgi:hypothetical protein
MCLSSQNTGSSVVTIALSDNKGKIIKKSLNTMTLNLNQNTKTLVELEFKHKLNFLT